MRCVMREERAQATVEMAVVTPVLIVLGLIVYNVMCLMVATARFDRVAPDVVIAQGVSPASGEGAAQDAEVRAAIERELTTAMEGHQVEIEVTSEDGDGTGEALLSFAGALKTYRCTMRYVPWPSGLSIAGVSMGTPAALSHERAVTVDPWRPGVVM